MNDDLELASTDDLIEELAGRCDHGIIILFRDGELGPNRHTVQKRWWGTHYMVAGMAQHVIHEVIQDMQEESHPVEDGE